MPRVLLLLPLLAVLQFARSAEVFVIADTANQTLTLADNAKETIAEANDLALANDTVTDSDDHEPVVRKKRTFGDVVFRGLADVLGYNVARKPPQAYVFPPPLAPVPGIDTPVQAVPVALYPVVAAGAAPAPAPAAPPCGAPRAAAPLPCRAQAPPPPPPPKPTQPPCPRPRANPRPRPKPAPKPRPAPPPPPPCAKPRANPTTPSPCAPAPPPPPPPKADPSLDTITSNFRLDFNFNRAPATAAPAAQEEQPEEQEQIAPVAIQPRAAQLPLEAPRTPRVYLDAFVVRNGVAQKVHAVDARNLNQNQADDDYLVYDDEEQPPQNEDDEYEYVEESRDRAKAVKEFGNAVDRFWEQKQKKKPKKKRPANDYRNVHFGDRDLVNQLREQNNEKLQYLKKEKPTKRIPLPIPEGEDEDEVTTTTQDPRRRLKPRVLPPTEQNPNQIDTVTVRVPPIYKEKHPKKLHRERPEKPDRDEEEEEAEEREVQSRESGEREYSSDSESENSDSVPQTEKPKRKRRRKQKRRTRSTYEPPYSAGDYDYYGKKLPISEEEKYFRGLTIPEPTRDADLARLEDGKSGGGHFLDDHERLADDPERIKTNDKNYDDERVDDKERADESERQTDDSERSYKDNERTSENERTGNDERNDDETERTDKLSPNARVRETNYQNNYVRATNVQVDDPRPLVSNVKKKTTKIGKA